MESENTMSENKRQPKPTTGELLPEFVALGFKRKIDQSTTSEWTAERIAAYLKTGGGYEALAVEINAALDAEREKHKVALQALDMLAVALAGHHHQWTGDQRGLYEHAVEVLKGGEIHTQPMP